jgi:hypothetical protein
MALRYSTTSQKTRRSLIREAATITSVTLSDRDPNIFVAASPSRTHDRVTYSVTIDARSAPFRYACNCPGHRGECGHKLAAAAADVTKAIRAFQDERWYAAQRRRWRSMEEEAAHTYYADEEVGA